MHYRPDVVFLQDKAFFFTPAGLPSHAPGSACGILGSTFGWNQALRKINPLHKTYTHGIVNLHFFWVLGFFVAFVARKVRRGFCDWVCGEKWVLILLSLGVFCRIYGACSARSATWGL